MEEFDLEFNFKARYYKLGEITQQTKQLWFVLHGYGQLAKYFLPKFETLQRHNICVVAPEGLSRFYLEDVTRRAASGDIRVGATWMTAENRLMDIANYLEYLQKVYRTVVDDSHSVPITLLGFSQGSATASRWAISHPENYERLILWAGVFPPDMDFEKGREILSHKQVTIVYGTNDPFINESRLSEMTSLTKRLGINAQVMTFNGGHEIHGPTLTALL